MDRDMPKYIIEKLDAKVANEEGELAVCFEVGSFAGVSNRHSLISKIEQHSDSCFFVCLENGDRIRVFNPSMIPRNGDIE